MCHTLKVLVIACVWGFCSAVVHLSFYSPHHKEHSKSSPKKFDWHLREKGWRCEKFPLIDKQESFFMSGMSLIHRLVRAHKKYRPTFRRVPSFCNFKLTTKTKHMTVKSSKREIRKFDISWEKSLKISTVVDFLVETSTVKTWLWDLFSCS